MLVSNDRCSWGSYLSRHVGGGALGLQLEQALRDDLGALLTSHQLLQRAQDLHKHLTPQGQADQPRLRLHACNSARARQLNVTDLPYRRLQAAASAGAAVIAHRLFY